MISEISIKEINSLKKGVDTKVLMVWSDSCHVCQDIKPKFEEVSDKYNMDFLTIELKDKKVYDFYSNYVEKQKVKTPSFDEDGDPILNARGQQIESFDYDEEGNIIERAPITVPAFFVFNPEASEESNEYGFLGKVDGHNLPMLESILTTIEKGEIDE